MAVWQLRWLAGAFTPSVATQIIIITVAQSRPREIRSNANDEVGRVQSPDIAGYLPQGAADSAVRRAHALLDFDRTDGGGLLLSSGPGDPGGGDGREPRADRLSGHDLPRRSRPAGEGYAAAADGRGICGQGDRCVQG